MYNIHVYEAKILLIDDNKFFCEMKKQMLEDSGYACDFSLSAYEGIEKLKSISFDLVLLDLNIGDVNGIDILPEIKNIDSDLPVIILTGHAEISTAVTAVKKGAYDYISKEVDDEEVLVRIEKALEKRKNAIQLKKPKAGSRRKIQFPQYYRKEQQDIGDF